MVCILMTNDRNGRVPFAFDASPQGWTDDYKGETYEEYELRMYYHEAVLPPHYPLPAIMERTMAMKEDMELAVKVGIWLGSKLHTPVAIETLDTGVIIINYTIGDKIQPPVLVTNQGVRFPGGSDLTLVLDFLGMQEGE